MPLFQLFSQTTRTNAATATRQLLQLLHVPVTASAVKEAVEFHPDADSLYSISDSLKKWRIETLALQVAKEDLAQLPLPFVAYSNEGGGKFQVVSGLDKEQVLVVSNKGKLEAKDKATFLQHWNGVALLAEPAKEAGEKTYSQHKKKEQLVTLRIPVFLGLLVLMVALIGVAAGVAWTYYVVALLKFGGLVVTVLLLWYEVDAGNPVLQQVCSGGKNTNCSAVLGSKVARLPVGLSWSEVGFSYFAGGLLLLLFGAVQASTGIALLAWLNVLALPYVLFSIFYQWRVAKQWCPLCLAVQALLAAEGIVFYLAHWTATEAFFNAVIIPTAIAAFALPLLLWAYTKPVWQKAEQTHNLRRSLARIQYHPEVFQSLLQKQKELTASPEGLGIVLGNPEAATSITKVCNPYCGPCAKAHGVMEELLESSKDVKMQIIFTATDGPDDDRAAPVRHFMAIAEKGDNQLLQKALDDWYDAKEKDYKAFAVKYPIDAAVVERQTPKLTAMSDWCAQMEVRATPTFFVNGYQLPELYNVSDLKQLV